MFDELRLPARAFERHNGQPCDRCRDLGAQVATHLVETQIETGSGARRCQHVTVVVGDIRMDGMDRDALKEVFWPMAHLPTANAWVVARARGDAGSVASAVRRVVQGIDPEIGIVELSTMGTVLRDSLWRQRFAAFLVGLLAALAVLIATGGLYAVIAHAVERRMHELGVRIALGATDGQVAQMVLGHGVRLTAIGTAPGAMLTMAASRVLAR